MPIGNGLLVISAITSLTLFARRYRHIQSNFSIVSDARRSMQYPYPPPPHHHHHHHHLFSQELIPTIGNLGLFYLTPEVHACLHADAPLMARVAQWKTRALASPTGFIDDDLTRGLRFIFFLVLFFSFRFVFLDIFHPPFTHTHPYIFLRFLSCLFLFLFYFYFSFLMIELVVLI